MGANPNDKPNGGPRAFDTVLWHLDVACITLQAAKDPNSEGNITELARVHELPRIEAGSLRDANSGSGERVCDVPLVETAKAPLTAGIFRDSNPNHLSVIDKQYCFGKSYHPSPLAPSLPNHSSRHLSNRFVRKKS
jgi:hypothetical protein